MGSGVKALRYLVDFLLDEVDLEEGADETLDVDGARSGWSSVEDELADGLLELLKISGGDVVGGRQGGQARAHDGETLLINRVVAPADDLLAMVGTELTL